MTPSALAVRKRTAATGLSRILLLLCLLLVLWPAGFQSSAFAANDSDDEEETGQSETNDNDDDDNDAVERSAPERGRTRSNVRYNTRSSVVATSKRSQDAVAPRDDDRLKRARRIRPVEALAEPEDVPAAASTTNASTSLTSAPRTRRRGIATGEEEFRSLLETYAAAPSAIRPLERDDLDSSSGARASLASWKGTVAPIVGPELILSVERDDGTTKPVQLPPFPNSVRRLPEVRPTLHYYRETVFADDNPDQQLMGRVLLVRSDASIEEIPNTDHYTEARAFYPMKRFTKIKEGLSAADRSRAEGLSQHIGKWQMSLNVRQRPEAMRLLDARLVHTEEQFMEVVSPKITSYFGGLRSVDDIEYLVIDINQFLTACSGCFDNIAGGNSTSEWSAANRSWPTILDRIGVQIGKDLSGIKVIVRLDAYSRYSSNYFPKEAKFYTDNLRQVISPVIADSTIAVAIPVTERNDSENRVFKAIVATARSATATTSSSTSTSSTRRAPPR